MDPVRPWGSGGCSSSKNVLGVFIQNFGYEIEQHFIQGPKLQIFFYIFGSGINLKSKIPSFQCEISNKAEHVRLLQEVNSAHQ